jgi:hypothetical protein
LNIVDMLLKHVNEYDDSELMLSGPNFIVDDLSIMNHGIVGIKIVKPTDRHTFKCISWFSEFEWKYDCHERSIYMYITSGKVATNYFRRS